MYDDDSISEISSDDDADSDKHDKTENPDIFFEKIPLKTSINRIRSMHYSNIVSAWGENGQIMIFDISKRMQALED